MAVYTEVSDRALTDFVAAYDIGQVRSCKGIAEGVENTNYLLQTERGSFILTLYEKRVAARDLPFFLGLMEHLSRRGIACPTPLHGRDGAALRRLCGRPAAIVTFLDGMWPRRPGAAHCAALGAAMARMHLAAADFPLRRANALSLAGWRALLARSGSRADEIAPGLEAEMADDLAFLADRWPTDLPTGVIHADLFPDNVFFRGETLTGIIDFYFACNDFLAYDLAVAINAWCFADDGTLDIARTQALVAAYRRVRECSAVEIAALPLLARGAALRFLATRVYDWLNRPEGAIVRTKSPLEFLQRLRFHRHAAGLAAYGLE